MRLTTVILITSLLQASASSFAQRVTISQQNATLQHIFQEIRRQSGYNLIYDARILPKQQKTSIAVKDATVNEALDAAIRDLPLTYEISERSVLIKKKIIPVTERISTSVQQDVKGKVVDSLGIGLTGATIAVKGAKGVGTSTNENGDFTLKNVAPDAVLIVSYLGYVTREAKAGTEFNYIQLQKSFSKLDEIQIQAYGKTSKRMSVGTTTTVKAEDIERQMINNPLLALRAKVPNLVITQANGLPGSPITIQLRGQNSMGAWSDRSEPLILIDGVPFQNTLSAKDGNYGAVGQQMSALSLINPNDIEQIDVLADADATAIYGSRGGNGVIMITTKKGKAGPALVNLNFSTGFSQVPGSNKMDLMNTQQYLEMRKEALGNDGFTAQISDPDGQGYAPDLLLWDQQRDIDWQKELLGRNPKWQQANLSITGGTNAMRYLISGNYRTDGVPYPTNFQGAKASSNSLASGHINLSGNSANGKFNAGIDLTYSYNSRNGTQNDLTKIAMLLPPNAPEIYRGNGELNWALNPQTNRASWKNPYADLLNIIESKANTIVGSLNMGYRLTPDIELKISSAFTKMTQKQFGAFPLAGINPYGDRNNYYGRSERVMNDNNSFTVDPNLTYQKRLGGGHLNAIIGMTYQGHTNLSETLKAGGYTDDALIRDLTKAGAPFGGSPYSAYNRSSQYKYLRMFSRFNYVLMDKYIANVSLSRDGSSRFGPENKYGNYWSTGLGWIYSNESFIKEALPFLSYGKVRATYGITGQDGIGDYKYLEQYSSDPGSSYDGVIVLDGQGVVNPYFKWENVKKLDIGFDFGFLNDAIVVSATYWKTRSSDQLLPVTTPATTGAGTYYMNIDAGIENYGWEFTLNTRNITGKDFSWSSAANFGFQNDKLLKLSPSVLNRYYNSYYLYKGIDPIGKSYNKLVGVPMFMGVDKATGVFQFLNEDGELTTAPDRDIYAKPVTINPLTLGLTNNFTYKNFSLVADLMFRKQLGRSYFDAAIPAGRLEMPQAHGNALAMFTDRWRKAGDDARFQKASSDNWDVLDGWTGFAESDISYVDASFIRLSNIMLNYRLPERLMKRWKMRNVSVNVSAQNLFTITPYEFGDPETQSYLSLPTLRTITAGFSLNF